MELFFSCNSVDSIKLDLAYINESLDKNTINVKYDNSSSYKASYFNTQLFLKLNKKSKTNYFNKYYLKKSHKDIFVNQSIGISKSDILNLSYDYTEEFVSKKEYYLNYEYINHLIYKNIYDSHYDYIDDSIYRKIHDFKYDYIEELVYRKIYNLKYIDGFNIPKATKEILLNDNSNLVFKVTPKLNFTSYINIKRIPYGVILSTYIFLNLPTKGVAVSNYISLTIPLKGLFHSSYLSVYLPTKKVYLNSPIMVTHINSCNILLNNYYQMARPKPKLYLLSYVINLTNNKHNSLNIFSDTFLVNENVEMVSIKNITLGSNKKNRIETNKIISINKDISINAFILDYMKSYTQTNKASDIYLKEINYKKYNISTNVNNTMNTFSISNSYSLFNIKCISYLKSNKSIIDKFNNITYKSLDKVFIFFKQNIKYNIENKPIDKYIKEFKYDTDNKQVDKYLKEFKYNINDKPIDKYIKEYYYNITTKLIDNYTKQIEYKTIIRITDKYINQMVYNTTIRLLDKYLKQTEYKTTIRLSDKYIKHAEYRITIRITDKFIKQTEYNIISKLIDNQYNKYIYYLIDNKSLTQYDLQTQYHMYNKSFEIKYNKDISYINDSKPIDNYNILINYLNYNKEIISKYNKDIIYLNGNKSIKNYSELIIYLHSNKEIMMKYNKDISYYQVGKPINSDSKYIQYLLSNHKIIKENKEIPILKQAKKIDILDESKFFSKSNRLIDLAKYIFLSKKESKKIDFNWLLVIMENGSKDMMYEKNQIQFNSGNKRADTNNNNYSFIKEVIKLSNNSSALIQSVLDSKNLTEHNELFILDKAKIELYLPEYKTIWFNKDLKELMFNEGTWIYNEAGLPPSFDCGGIDELLLPQNDFDYSTFKDALIDPITHTPTNKVKVIDDKTFIAKVPVNHPMPECFGIGTEYIDVDVTLLKLLIDRFYNIWHINIFNFGAMDMRDAVGKMMKLIEAYIIYNISDTLMEPALRIVRLMRWYGEASIMKHSEYKIHMKYTQLKSDIFKGDCAIPYIADNMEINLSKYTITNYNISKDCYIDFILDNPVGTTISLSVYITNGTVDVTINNTLVDTILVSSTKEYPVVKATIGNSNIIRLYFNNYSGNGIINIANIIINDYIYSDIITEYSPTIGSGNKVLDDMLKSVYVYSDVYANSSEYIRQAINGNIAVTDLIVKLQDYFYLHHEKKVKGKRLVTKI